MYLSVCLCILEQVTQRTELYALLELELEKVVSQLMWILATKLASPAHNH